MFDSEKCKAVGHRLSILRREKGWSLTELSSKIDLSASQLKKYESGLGVASEEKLEELASLLSTSISYLLTGDDRSIKE